MYPLEGHGSELFEEVVDLWCPLLPEGSSGMSLCMSVGQEQGLQTLEHEVFGWSDSPES